MQEKNLKKFNLTSKIDLVEDVYYMRQVFHLLDDNVTLAEELLYFFLNIIDICIIR